MANFDVDLFVIGAGSGGVRAARMCAQAGARVAIAEDRQLGGTCVNVGCVPKKLFVHASHFAEDYEDARGFGWGAVQPTFDWPTLRDNKNTEIARLNGIYGDLLNNAGVLPTLHGAARMVDPHTVEVDGTQVRAEKVLIATGSWPTVPSVPGRELVITSNEAFHLPQFPAHVTIVGGGYIAVEFAGIFQGLGAEVVQLYRGPLFLRGFDDSVRQFVGDEVRKKGIDLRMNARVTAIEGHPGDLRVMLEDGSHIETELVMYATGRHARTADLDLARAGVTMRKDGSIPVDDAFRTNVPGIFALGDVVGGLQLTPVAIAEGMNFAQTQFEGRPTTLNYANIPTAVFCQPNIGTVGLTEAEARQRSSDLDIYETSFRAMKHTLSGSAERTLMKLIVDRPSDRVLGVHMVGADAGEIIQGMGVALQAGATKAVFDATMALHPTSAEEFVTMREVSRN